MLIGIGVLSYAAPGLEKYFIKDPSVDTGIVIFATVLLVISGLIAGYVPARRAGKIKPIVALNDA
jgi:putative ABC transport system permease protein